MTAEEAELFAQTDSFVKAFEDAMDDCLKEMQSLIISNPSISSVVQNNFGSIKTNYNSYEE